MKTLLRICVLFCVVVLIVLVGAFFYFSNAGVQKRLVEDRLPAGSSVETVKLGLGEVELSGLVLTLEDGTRVELGDLATAFELLPAIFDRTIKLGQVAMEDLRVVLPQRADTISAPSPSVTTSGAAEPAVDSAKELPAPEYGNEPFSFDQVYAIGEMDWLVDIEGVDVGGVLIDASGAEYTISLVSNLVRPGERSTVSLKIESVFAQPLQSGLQSFSSQQLLHFMQNTSGGFSDFLIISKASAADSAGDNLLYSDQKLEASIDPKAKTATLAIEFEGDLARPEAFFQEFAGLGAIAFEGQATAALAGEVLTLNEADLGVMVDQRKVLSLLLKKAMTLGGEQNFVGELLDLKINQMPAAWLNPWLSEGAEFTANPLSAELSVSGESDGSMRVEFGAPFELTQFSYSQDGEALLENLDLRLSPTFTVRSDQIIDYTLSEIELADTYGAFVKGQSSGQLNLDADRTENPFAGIKSDLDLNLSLQPLLQQPVLASRTSILGGSMRMDATVDSSQDYPVVLQSSIEGLRVRANPALTKDYRIAAQAKPGKSNTWMLGASLLAGNPERATTELQLSGGVQAGSHPLKFKMELSGAQVSQSDLDHLAQAFAPREEVVPQATKYRSNVPSQRQASTGPIRTEVVVESPPWAMLDGTAKIAIETFTLSSGRVIEQLSSEAVISESLLKIDQSNALIEGGTFNGAMEVRYSEGLSVPYEVAGDFKVKDIDPSAFATTPGKSFPVQGLFNGDLKVSGTGVSLEEAFDRSHLDLELNGREGVVTAFEMDERSTLGLGIAGLLGQQFDRPGISALTNTIPYFKDIRFNKFDLKVTRGNDQRMLIPTLSFQGDSLLIEGSGAVAAGGLSELMNQPLNLQLELGAKGRLTNYLETLELLQPATSEDGFRRWASEINIAGTLARPNTDELTSLLRQAARTAFKKPSSTKQTQSGAESASTTEATDTESSAQNQGQTQAPRKEVDEVDIAIDLLNSFF